LIKRAAARGTPHPRQANGLRPLCLIARACAHGKRRTRGDGKRPPPVVYDARACAHGKRRIRGGDPLKKRFFAEKNLFFKEIKKYFKKKSLANSAKFPQKPRISQIN
jgi:hypothetical protein